jgi:hypothetical protein
MVRVSVRSLTGLIDPVPDWKISHLGKSKMLQSGLDLSRCVKGGHRLQLAARVQAIQLCPYIQVLGRVPLINDFSGRPFPDMLFSPLGYPAR